MGCWRDQPIRHRRQARQPVRRQTRPVPQLELSIRRRAARLRSELPAPFATVVLSAARKAHGGGQHPHGTIRRFSGTAVISILDLLFEAGGTNTVRGYPEESLSTFNVAGFALGGTDLLILNGELRFPISKLFSGAVFVDAGNTFASTADIALDQLAVGAGLGLRVRTPWRRCGLTSPIRSARSSDNLACVSTSRSARCSNVPLTTRVCAPLTRRGP